jgi:hypothetical protein
MESVISVWVLGPIIVVLGECEYTIPSYAQAPLVLASLANIKYCILTVASPVAILPCISPKHYSMPFLVVYGGEGTSIEYFIAPIIDHTVLAPS